MEKQIKEILELGIIPTILTAGGGFFVVLLLLVIIYYALANVVKLFKRRNKARKA